MGEALGPERPAAKPQEREKSVGDSEAPAEEHGNPVQAMAPSAHRSAVT